MASFPLQPRRTFDKAKLQELAASIRGKGMYQPIRVRFDETAKTYRIISGERRYRAAVIAGLAQVPCIIADPKTTDRDVLVEQVVENWQRADLEPVELSNALARLRDKYKTSQEEIAKLTGKSPGEISKLLSIQRVDVTILAEAKDDDSGRFTRRTLVAIAGLETKDQKEMAGKIRAGMPLAEVKRVASRLKKQGRGERLTRAVVAIRRFVVGSATVEVRFRKRDVSSDDVVDALRRAADMAKE